MKSLILAVLLVAGCSSAAVTPAPTVVRTQVTRSGTATETTDKFALAGDYQVDWSSAGTGCEITAFLADGVHIPATIASVSPGTGSSHLYGLAATLYYLTVAGSCPWRFVLTPI